MLDLTCDQCNQSFSRYRGYQGKLTFCSRDCYLDWQREHRRGISYVDGRVMIRRPDHPAARATDYIARSRIIMEDIIGRYLGPDEVVHHINGNKTDDHPENLMVLSRSDHQRLHMAARRPQHCPQGHPYTPENTYVYEYHGRTFRHCKTCIRLRNRASYKSTPKEAPIEDEQ